MSLQQFTTQLTPPLQRLICEYMGRGFIGIVCPGYFESLYGVTDDKCQQHKLASEIIGREGDMLSYSMILHYVDVEYVARGAAAVDSTDLINYMMANRVSTRLDNGLMWGYAAAGNYGGFQHMHKTMILKFGGPTISLLTYEAGMHALAGALVRIETDSGVFANMIAAKIKLEYFGPIRVIQIIHKDAKKYSPRVVDWLMPKLSDDEDTLSVESRALSDLIEAIAT